MEERRRTRSQGPPSLAENNELIQWDSLQDPVRIEREQAEAHRLARQINMITSTAENRVESSEILARAILIKSQKTQQNTATHAHIG